MESSFYSESSYAIVGSNMLSPVKTLSYTHISGIIPLDKNADQWLKENRNYLRKEAEVAAFLTYYNLR